MTIAALLALLDEIDAQGGPEAARHNRLHLPDDDRTPMDTTDFPEVQRRAQDAEHLPLGALLKWGDEHPDKDIQDQAARARMAVHGLRTRYAADQELAAITSEAADLEKRLAELRAREAELAPAKPKSKRKGVDYPAAEVRVWAKENGVAVPALGRVPKAVVDAWRQATARPAAPSA